MLASGGRIGHFWQRYPPPISGPCHRWWPLCFSVNRMTSGTSCSLSAPVGCGWADWTMTCVCENLCQGWGQIWAKTKDFSIRWILKCHKLSWSLITSMKADKKKNEEHFKHLFPLNRSRSAGLTNQSKVKRGQRSELIGHHCLHGTV